MISYATTLRALLLIFIPCSLTAQVFVDVNNNNSLQTGTTWQTAFSSLQVAVDKAMSGEEIWVKEGIYYPTTTFDRSEYILINKVLKMYGGFKGDEIQLEDREQNSYSIISGDIGVKNNLIDNSYTLFYLENVGSGALIDGFVFENGNANDTAQITSLDIPSLAGGAVFISANNSNCIPYFVNCHFNNNYAYGYGGAIHSFSRNQLLAYPIISNCHFESNSTHLFGGSIYFGTIKNISSDTLISNTKFIRNKALYGGAIYMILTEGSGNTIKDCKFIENETRIGGAAAYIEWFSNANLTLVDCDFIESRSAFGTGAGLFVANYSTSESTLSLIGLLVDNCYSTLNDTISGQGDFITSTPLGSSFSIEIKGGEFFKSNFSWPSSKSKLNIDRGYFESITFDIAKPDKLNISNSIFRNSNFVGALNANQIFYFSNIVYDVGIKDSVNFLSFSGAGNSEVKIINSILNLNQIDAPGYLLYGNDIKLSVQNSLTNKYSLNRSVIGRDPEGIPPTLDTLDLLYGIDPLFRNIQSGDYRILSCSPAVNFGSNEVLSILESSMDFGGNERLVDSIIDAGPYEVASPFFFKIDSITDVFCDSNALGEIKVSVGGESPLALSIVDSNGFNYPLDSLNAGFYKAFLNASDGCQIQDSFNINFFDKSIISVQQKDNNCFGEKFGEIQLINESTIELTNVSWEDGSFGLTRLGLSSGTYNAEITNTYGCITAKSVNITEPEDIIISANTTRPKFNSTKDGEIDIEVVGGVPPYKIFWEDTNSQLFKRDSLGVGEYDFYIEDSNECIKNGIVELTSFNESFKNSITVYPSPVAIDKPITIDIFSNENTKVLVSVFNISGKIIDKEEFILVAGENKFIVESKFFGSGLYFFSFKGFINKTFPVVILRE